jgi:D-amino-acid oxidase
VHYTSDKAGAHWFSFAAAEGEVRKQALDELSFHALMGLAVTEPDSGVSILQGHAFYEQPGSVLPEGGGGGVVPPLGPLPWFSALVPRFRLWSSAELAERAQPQNGGVLFARAFSYETAMIDAPHYVQWLLRIFLAQGGVMLQGETLTSLADAWIPPTAAAASTKGQLELVTQKGVTKNFSASSSAALPVPQVVVNCCALGSLTLRDVQDQGMVPDRGQTIVIRAPQIRAIWRVPGDLPTYVLPRGDGTVVLGGTHQYGDSTTSVDASIAEAILARCRRVLPLLRDTANYEVIAHGVGIRPARQASNTTQRIEVDEQLSERAAATIAAAGAASAGTAGTSSSSSSSAAAGAAVRPLLVHNYGHGGDGFQSSWGSALVVAHLIHRARPQLFAHQHAALWHLRHNQQRTGLIERAMKPDHQQPMAKL